MIKIKFVFTNLNVISQPNYKWRHLGKKRFMEEQAVLSYISLFDVFIFKDCFRLCRKREWLFCLSISRVFPCNVTYSVSSFSNKYKTEWFGEEIHRSYCKNCFSMHWSTYVYLDHWNTLVEALPSAAYSSSVLQPTSSALSYNCIP